MQEPTKCVLQLYIDSSLKQLAKSSGMNLSKEFEEWIKIRLGQPDNMENTSNPDQEIIRLRAEIQKLESQKEINAQKADIEKEKIMVVDGVIDNMVEFNDDLINIADARIHGIQFLLQKKFRTILNPLQAKEILEKRIKERGLIG